MTDNGSGTGPERVRWEHHEGAAHRTRSCAPQRRPCEARGDQGVRRATCDYGPYTYGIVVVSGAKPRRSRIGRLWLEASTWR
ncbi:hypothetical protein SHIRM173S_09539 [Streptomyces hirsutus]